MRFWVLRFGISALKVYDSWVRGDGVGCIRLHAKFGEHRTQNLFFPKFIGSFLDHHPKPF